MDKSKVERVKELTAILNEARDTYYNKATNKMTDKEYDDLFDELSLLEKETGTILNNSPTQTVGYEVKSKLNKVTHNHPMLSLGKTKLIEDVVEFLDGRDGIAMLKMDGLTCSNGYGDYELSSSETRGNGETGEDILHNSKTIKNLPLKITIDNLIVDGEVIIDYDTFNKINEKLPENEQYKNPRNLASGSIRQLDNKIALQRNMKFIAWKVISGIDTNSHCERLSQLEKLGFEVVPFVSIYNIKSKHLMEEKIEEVIAYLKNIAKELHYPIDGIVFGYDDIKYGESLGATGHHLRSQIAYKFYDDLVETPFRGVELKTSRYGIASITGLFDPVEIDGTTITRASLHNVDIFNSLQLGIGDIVQVYKANAIIPQISDNLDRSGTFKLPMVCPVCGNKLQIIKRIDTNELYCDNEDCKSRLLGKLTHFASKPAMNIDGLSEATLEFLIEKGWVNSYIDLYSLDKYKSEWMRCEGFGKSSVTKLLEAIEKSKHVKLENFLIGLSIPLIGKTASKTISKYCKGVIDTFEILIDDGFDFTTLEDFGVTMHESIIKWFNKTSNALIYGELAEIFAIINQEEKVEGNGVSLNGLTFVITGSVTHFKNRDEVKSKIESLGGKVSGSVSAKTNYLINNDITSNSGKNKDAKKLNIPIITEEQFLTMINK